ncbi:MAG TPA: DUF2268 domain-containing putative Zn-dependent protease [Verrucomicrobiae bacterium]|nr:DUF2268 domain-containing putative Zn-dependent protease [Verrucomicrobiae bacterium]
MIERVAADRFTVHLTARAVQKASAVGVNLPTVVHRSLVRINALLPGPPTTISVVYMGPGQVISEGRLQSGVIPDNGTAGVTNVTTGEVRVGFGPTAHVRLATSIRTGLPRTMAHEVDHTVRILRGPGFGSTLLDSLISEGIASAFDIAAFPGPPDPWENALIPAQQCTWWRKAVLDLPDRSLYEQWMFGYFGVPRWTGFTLGYHIVQAYRLRHPHESWRALTDTSASAILVGSHYDPCDR